MTPIRALRIVAALEGLSFVALVFVAMPLKYGWETPGPVRIVGMIHGVLFLGYVAAVAWTARSRAWDRMAIAHALAASVIPFATVWLDAELREQELSARRGSG